LDREYLIENLIRRGGLNPNHHLLLWIVGLLKLMMMVLVRFNHFGKLI
jgi:hypothetical protein